MLGGSHLDATEIGPALAVEHAEIQPLPVRRWSQRKQQAVERRCCQLLTAPSLGRLPGQMALYIGRPKGMAVEGAVKLLRRDTARALGTLDAVDLRDFGSSGGVGMSMVSVLILGSARSATSSGVRLIGAHSRCSCTNTSALQAPLVSEKKVCGNSASAPVLVQRLRGWKPARHQRHDVQVASFGAPSTWVVAQAGNLQDSFGQNGQPELANKGRARQQPSFIFDWNCVVDCHFAPSTLQ